MNRTLESALATIAAEQLYLFPAGAGSALVREYSAIAGQERQSKWLQQVLSWEAGEIVQWLEREGDEEDKMVYLDVYLWRQRLGLIDRTVQAKYVFRNECNAYRLHRYMLANGYTGILDKPRARSVRSSYFEEIDSLLSRFKLPEFSLHEDEFGNLALLLSVIGPCLKSYSQLSEVHEFTAYIVANCTTDERLRSFREDVSLSSLMLLLSDLEICSPAAFQAFLEFLSGNLRRSILIYPALVSALQMFGDSIKKHVDTLSLQGGNELFFKLLSAE